MRVCTIVLFRFCILLVSKIQSGIVVLSTLEIAWYDNFFRHNCIFKIHGRLTLENLIFSTFRAFFTGPFSHNALLQSSEGLL